MKLRSAFLATHAEVRENLAFVSGAFPEWWKIPAVNAPQIIGFVANLEYDESEVGKTFNYLLGLQPPQGAVIGVAFFNARMEESETGGPRYFIVALNLNVVFNTTGVHNFILSSSDERGMEDIASVPLNVRLADSSPLPDSGLNIFG